jgi:hypothetical protein
MQKRTWPRVRRRRERGEGRADEARPSRIGGRVFRLCVECEGEDCEACGGLGLVEIQPPRDGMDLAKEDDGD